LAVTATACGGAGSSGAETPGERIVAAMELIRDGRPNELAAFVVRDDQDGVAMFSGVYSSGWSGEGGLDRVEVVSESVVGDSATVAAKFHFANGRTEDVTYRLEQEDDAWKIRLP
jgi:hypothetical protein